MQQDREERIRARAHRIWEDEGRPLWQAERHWDMARALVDSDDETSSADALHSPSAHFESPQDVAGDERLTRDEKKKALGAWQEDAEALQRAEDEGMGGGEPTRLIETMEAQKAVGMKAPRRKVR